MKKFTQVIFIALVAIICIILEVLQKLVIWDSTLVYNIKYTYKDAREVIKTVSKKIYWPEVIGACAAVFMCMAVYFYTKNAYSKFFISAFLSIIVISWSLLLDTRPVYQVTGNNKWSFYVIFLLCIMIVLFSSCSRGQCPTTDKKYFFRGVPSSKSLYKGYGRERKGWIVPYKYRKTSTNYGKLK